MPNNIVSTKNNATVVGTSSADSIYVSGNNSYVTGGRGNDTISLASSSRNVVVRYASGDGRDLIRGMNSSDILEITSGTISSTRKVGANTILTIGSGQITIVGTAFTSNIRQRYNISRVGQNLVASDYNDSIYNSNFDRATIFGGSGDDSIYDLGGSYNSIAGGKGNDVISLSSSSKNVTIGYAVGDGNDVIYGFDSNDVFNVTSGTINSSVRSGNDLILTIGSGKVTLKGVGNKSLTIYPKTYNASGTKKIVKGTSSNDILMSQYNFTTLFGGGGNDSIYIAGNSSSVAGGAGNDTINLAASAKNVTVGYSNGDGNDSVYGLTSEDLFNVVSGSISSSIRSGANAILNIGSGRVTLVGASARTVNIRQNFRTTRARQNLTTGIYNDSIYNSYASVTMNSGGGNDSIYNYKSNRVSINAGAGNDSVYLYSTSYSNIDGGAGNDSIYVYQGTQNRILGGDGNDSIYNFSSVLNTASISSTIDAGAGNDSIINSASYSSISGGRGNDLISISAASAFVTLNYASGDGNDTVYGFSSGDILNITSGLISSSVRSGSNLTLNIGSGKISFIGTGSQIKVKQNYIVSTTYQSLTASSDNDSITNSSFMRATMNAGAGNDSIYNYRGHYSSIFGNSGNDSIYVLNSNQTTALGGIGNDTIINSLGNYNQLFGNDGYDYIDNFNSAGASIIGGAGNDTIVNRKSSATSIVGGKGNDLISLTSDSQRVTLNYASGDGNDTVYGFDSNDVFNVTSGTINSTVKSGNNLILTIGSGKVTLIGVGNKNLNIYQNYRATRSNQAITSSSLDDFISNTGFNSVKINAGAGNDTIDNRGSYSSIYGGKGDDSILLSSTSKNVTIGYSTGDGNDIIRGFSSDDVLNISGTISSSVKSGSNVILKIGSGNISLMGVGNQKLNIQQRTISRRVIGDYYSDDTISEDSSTLWGNVDDRESDLLSLYSADSNDTSSILSVDDVSRNFAESGVVLSSSSDSSLNFMEMASFNVPTSTQREKKFF